MTKLLIHVCCGPCATIPLRQLAGKGLTSVTLFDNANIQPEEEYANRLATWRNLASELGVEVLTGAYEPALWDEAIGERAGVYPLVEGDEAYGANLNRRKARCRACYAFRFERLAARAKTCGCSQIATTLSISPYQFTTLMAQELEAAATRAGLNSAFEDYRSWFKESVQLARELGLYRQNYCGCRYSRIEAELERAARKRERVVRKQSKGKVRQTNHV